MSSKTPFGFYNRRNTEDGESLKSSQLEQQLNVRIDPNKTNDELIDQGEQYMEIFIEDRFSGTTRSIVGIYRGTTARGANIIKPSIFPRGMDEDKREKFAWLNEASFFYGEITGFRPATRETLEACASGLENMGVGNYIGKDSPTQSQLCLFD
jgi:hypothetical protein